MKKIVVLCFIWTLQGLNAFGQANALPPTSHSVPPHPELKAQKGAARLKTVSVAVVSPLGALSRRTEIQPVQTATFRRIEQAGLLMTRISKNDPGAALETIFRPENDQWGDTGIRDPVITIFPRGR